MSPFETSNNTEDSLRRYVVAFKNPQPRLWETEEAHAFIENLRWAEGMTRLRNCSWYPVILISFQIYA